jgi:hypothetical protein
MTSGTRVGVDESLNVVLKRLDTDDALVRYMFTTPESNAKREVWVAPRLVEWVQKA